jgi:hypothetical protein
MCHRHDVGCCGSAQTNKGGISGTVVDANGAAVPGATVTITNLGTGQKITVTTSETGSYTVPVIGSGYLQRAG